MVAIGILPNIIIVGRNMVEILKEKKTNLWHG